MKSRHTPRPRKQRAFTLIELLVVIAIIAILAAILVPVFAQVREQARQSNTMANMHAVYVGAKMFNEDEGHYPSVLFGYAEVPDNSLNPPQRPALTNANIVPMNQAKNFFITNLGSVQQGVNRGYLYPEQVKDYKTFTTPENTVDNRQAVTQVFYPHNSVYKPDQLVVWETPTGPCTNTGDRDIPNASANYPGQPKLYYVMDSMDIGPRLSPTGAIMHDPSTGAVQYELHYSPDWTHKLGGGCEPADPNNGGQINVTQLKYKNPPSDRTVLTYVTEHVATANSSKVQVILLSGTAKKMDVKDAARQLPMYYRP